MKTVKQAETGKQAAETVLFNFRCPRDLRDWFRVQAIRDGRQLQDLANEALEQYRRRREKKGVAA